MKRRKTEYVLAASVFLLTFLVYLPALLDGFVQNWDDGDYIINNLAIRSLDLNLLKWAFLRSYAANWHPLTWLSHAVDYALWGLNPLGYHLTNNILHAVNAVLVLIVTKHLLDYARRIGRQEASLSDGQVLAAAGVTALFFALHPLRVESVAWVSERKDLLCALFFLLSVRSYFFYAAGKSSGDYRSFKSPRTYKHYLFSLTFFVLALLSKPMAVSLPLVLLILDWYPFGRRGFPKAVLAEKIPFFLLSLFSSVVTMVAQSKAGAMELLAFVPLKTRLLVAVKSLVAYLWTMVLPFHLAPFYPYPKEVSLFSVSYLLPVLFVAGITAGALFAAKKNRLWLSVWAFYVITLLPVLGIVQVGEQSMADRYTYLPCLAPSLLAAIGAVKLYGAAGAAGRPGKALRGAVLGCGAAAAILFSIGTVRQIGVWKDSLTFCNYLIREEPSGAYFAYNDRGVIYSGEGQYDRAIGDYNTAIALKPDFFAAYSNRGWTYGMEGHYDRAFADFAKAIAIKPGYARASNNRGVINYRRGFLDAAVRDFDRAIELDPDSASAYYNRGSAYLKEGDRTRALPDFRRACELGSREGCDALKGQP